MRIFEVKHFKQAGKSSASMPMFFDSYAFNLKEMIKPKNTFLWLCEDALKF